MDIDTTAVRRKPSWDPDAPEHEEVAGWVMTNQYDLVRDAFERFALPTSNLLHEAQSGAMVDLLVRNGADVNQTYREKGLQEHRGPDPIDGEEQEARNDTPLQAAVLNGNKEVFDRLLANGADVEIGGDRRPLLLALGYRPGTYHTGYPPGTDEGAMVAMANTLLDHHARVFAERGEMPALVCAVDIGHQAPMVKRLLDAGGDARQGFEDQGTPLHCVRDSQPGVADLLLDYGANVDEPTNDEIDETPLEVATYNGQIKTAQRLIERNADIDQLMQKSEWNGYITMEDPPRRATAEYVRSVAVEREKESLRQAAEVEREAPIQQPVRRPRPRL